VQQITIIAVGKATGYYATGVADYQKRLGALCRLNVIELAEERLDEKNASQAQIAAALEKEGARILAAVPKGAGLAALCIEGHMHSSEQFSQLIQTQAMRGASHMAFAIGSSHGLSAAVKQSARWLLSLSAMTLPHQLARLVLAEQVYRAFMIQSNTRYHK
jgi:23S rRNA (pseudouridine1915-N3)-methyltransferase